MRCLSSSAQWIALALGAAVVCPPTCAGADRQDHNGHLWLGYMGDHPVAGGPWGVHLETQVRLADYGRGWQQLLIRPGINYTLNDQVAFSGGYCYVETYTYGDFPAADNFPEHRVWEQVTVTVPWLGLDWVNRFRLEQRNIGELAPQPGGGFGVARYRYENRIRYQLRTTVPFGESGRNYGVAWNEVFLNFGENVVGNTFDQNRAFLGFGRKLGSAFKLEAGFLEQTLQRRGGRIWEHNHTLVLYLSSKAPLGSAQP
jgi:hypothetical protein